MLHNFMQAVDMKWHLLYVYYQMCQSIYVGDYIVTGYRTSVSCCSRCIVMGLFIYEHTSYVLLYHHMFKEKKKLSIEEEFNAAML